MTALDWKVYDRNGVYTAATKQPAEAAMLVSVLGVGARIKYRHHTLCWSEGKEDRFASDSYDHVAGVCNERVNETRRFANALDELTRRAPAFQAAEVELLAGNIASKHRVKSAELLDAYKKARAKQEKRAAAHRRTSESLSGTLNALLKGDK